MYGTEHVARNVNMPELAKLFVNGNHDEGYISTKNLYFVGKTMYSFGSHFPLAYKARGVGNYILLNNDYYSMRTRKHQSVIRNAVPSYWAVSVSFALLKKLGIDYKRIEIVDVERSFTSTVLFKEVLPDFNESYYLLEVDAKTKFSPFNNGQSITYLGSNFMNDEITSVEQSRELVEPYVLQVARDIYNDGKDHHIRFRDYYLVESQLTDESMEKRVGKQEIGYGVVAHEVAYIGDKMYVKGYVRHPDRKQVHLKEWYAVIENPMFKQHRL